MSEGRENDVVCTDPVVSRMMSPSMAIEVDVRDIYLIVGRELHYHRVISDTPIIFLMHDMTV
jgi:hypothetical protein